MLHWIRVKNIAVIDELEVSFEPGLNLVTGETGAGKSLLVDALGLALGSRASTDQVRTGASSAVVEGCFELVPLPEKLQVRLATAGIDVDRGEIIIRREISSSGRGRVAVNGCAGGSSLLRDIAPYLADIHGQGENASLLRPEAGLELLDRLASNESLRDKVGESYRRWVELGREKGELARQAKDLQARQELLEFQAAEIDKAGIEVGEDQALEEERQLLVHEERLRSAADDAYRILYDAENSVLSGLARVWKRVAELAEIDSRLAPFIENQSPVSSQLEDLALFLRDYREQIRFTPGRLDQVEERLAFLGRLKKKYGGSLASVIAHRQDCRRSLEQFENKNAHLTELQDQIAAAGERFLDSARDLSARRRQTAHAFEKRVERELRGLAMEKARFAIKISDARDHIESTAGWRETGFDVVELAFSANPGEELRSVSRIASGGEFSRFMLALKSLGTKGEQPKTLIFDEVDTGIEGRVADVVGQKLKELSRAHQVICITHLPQIASFADVHYLIKKTVSHGRTATQVERLDHQGRVEEIARMLAGAVITDSARRHAEQLVAGKVRNKI